MTIAHVLFGAAQPLTTFQFSVTTKPLLIKAFGLAQTDFVTFNEIVIQSGGPMYMDPGLSDACGRPSPCCMMPCLPPDTILGSRPFTMGCCQVWLGTNGAASIGMVPIYVPGDYVAIFHGTIVNQVVTLEEAEPIIDWAKVYPPSSYCCAGAPPA